MPILIVKAPALYHTARASPALSRSPGLSAGKGAAEFGVKDSGGGSVLDLGFSELNFVVWGGHFWSSPGC